MKNKKTEKRVAEKRRVFLVEDHPITLEGLTQIINYQTDLAVCGQADTTAAALKKIPTAKPDLVITDMTLISGNGIDLIKDLAVQHPRLPVVVLSMHDEKIYAERVLRAGARGYVMKSEPSAILLSALRAVLAGKVFVSEAMRSKLLGTLNGQHVDDATGLEALSDRELEVFRLLGQGEGTTSIARRLNVSVSTIETYRSHIKGKLGLTKANELVAAAVRWVDSTT